jgi:terminase small subunit / prophage DNA-packing protein
MVDVAIEQLAGLCGLSSTAVTTLARRGIMIRAGKGKFQLEASVRNYCTHLREQAVGRKAGDTPAKERQRLAKAMADSVELKNAVRRGTLVDGEAVVREWEGICRTVRAGMLRVPKRAAVRLPHLTPRDVLALDEEVRAALTELRTRGNQSA